MKSREAIMACLACTACVAVAYMACLACINIIYYGVVTTKPLDDKEFKYHRVTSSNALYYLIVKRSQYIRIENHLHKQSKKAMYIETRRFRSSDFTISNKPNNKESKPKLKSA